MVADLRKIQENQRVSEFRIDKSGFAEVNNLKNSVNGIEMYYEKTGEGRPLVLVHGNGADHKTFQNSIELLNKHFTVYAVDSRGHGQSSKVGELHYTDMADDMTAFMEQLDLKDVVYFGHSDGAIIGLLAAMRTDRIGLLLAGGANMTPKGAAAWIRTILKVVYAVKKSPQLRLMLMEPNITPEELGTICTPTVVIAGSKDIILEKETKCIAASIPGAKLRIIEGAGHTSYVTAKGQLAKLILEEAGDPI